MQIILVQYSTSTVTVRGGASSLSLSEFLRISAVACGGGCGCWLIEAVKSVAVAKTEWRMETYRTVKESTNISCWRSNGFMVTCWNDPSLRKTDALWVEPAQDSPFGSILSFGLVRGLCFCSGASYLPLIWVAWAVCLFSSAYPCVLLWSIMLHSLSEPAPSWTFSSTLNGDT
jgi:hypothetical protein